MCIRDRPQTQVGEVDPVGVIAAADAAGVADAVLGPVDHEPVQMLTVPAEGDLQPGAGTSATLASPGTSSRRQISGLPRAAPRAAGRRSAFRPVSYTHLTLPTKRIV